MYDPNERAMLPVLYQCQARGCYRASLANQDARRWWLIAPHRDDPTLLVIRCPEHQTDWALRQTVYGRLKALRLRARQARKLQLPPATRADPFLSQFIGARRQVDEWEDVPDPREFMDFDYPHAHGNRDVWEWTYGPEQRDSISRSRSRRLAKAPKRDWHGQFVAQRRMKKQRPATTKEAERGRRKRHR